MLYKAFSVRDQKGEVYNLPFYKKTLGEAERDFASLLKDEKSMVHQYPEDFDLYHIGEYDDQKGIFIPLDTPLHVVKAVSISVR